MRFPQPGISASVYFPFSVVSQSGDRDRTFLSFIDLSVKPVVVLWFVAFPHERQSVHVIYTYRFRSNLNSGHTMVAQNERTE